MLPSKMKKPSLEDAMAGAFMAGADFVAPKKQKHKPLIKFLGKRALLQDKVIFLRVFVRLLGLEYGCFFLFWAALGMESRVTTVVRMFWLVVVP